jgi:hypothetical protein
VRCLAVRVPIGVWIARSGPREPFSSSQSSSGQNSAISARAFRARLSEPGLQSPAFRARPSEPGLHSPGASRPRGDRVAFLAPPSLPILSAFPACRAARRPAALTSLTWSATPACLESSAKCSALDSALTSAHTSPTTACGSSAWTTTCSEASTATVRSPHFHSRKSGACAETLRSASTMATSCSSFRIHLTVPRTPAGTLPVWGGLATGWGSAGSGLADLSIRSR